MKRLYSKLPDYPYPPRAPAGGGKVICESRLSLLICLCIILAVVLVPDPSELARRVVADGNIKRIHALASEAVHVPAVPLSLPAKGLTTVEKLRELVALTTEESLANPAVPAEFVQLCTQAEAPVAALSELSTHRAELPHQLHLTLLEKLAQRALALGHPNEAAVIYTSLVQQESQPQFLAEAVKCWRWAAQPARALGLIDSFADQPSAPVASELLALRSTLALECNQPERAFDFAFTAYGQCPREQRGNALRQLLALAHGSDRFEKVTPLLEHYLAGFSFTRQPLAEVTSDVRAGLAFPSIAARSEFISFGTALAHWHEWAEPPRPEPALDLYLKLALLGDSAAYSRCKELFSDLLRGADFAVVLEALVQVGTHLDDEPLLARLLAEQGQAQKAVQYLHDAILHEPQRASLWRSLAEIYVDTSDGEHAIEPLEILTILAGDDAWAHRQLAMAYVQVGRFDQALPLYHRLLEIAPQDTESLESYAALAESMAQPERATAALQALLRVPGHLAQVDDYLDLAGNYRTLGRSLDCLTALRAGFAKYSSSPRLRLNLAETLAETNPAEALDLLCHSTLKDNTEAIRLLAEIANHASNPRPALDFIAQHRPACLADLPIARFQLALAEERSGDNATAAQVVEQLLSDRRFERAMAWQTLAQTALDIGDHERAERFQQRYVAYQGSNDSLAWNLLGDIYTLRGKQTEAATAYERSLRALVSGKKNRTLASAPFTTSR